MLAKGQASCGVLASACAERLLRRSDAALQRAGDGAGFIVGIGGFTGKEQRVLDRLPEGAPCRAAANRNIAVGTARKRILLPVVVVVPLQLAAHVDSFAEKLLQNLDRLARDLRR